MSIWIIDKDFFHNNDCSFDTDIDTETDTGTFNNGCYCCY